MAKCTTKKILDALQIAGLIDGWSSRTVSHGSRVKWRQFTVESALVGVSHEAYGSSVEMYFRCETDEAAGRIWDVLSGLGYASKRQAFEWCPDYSSFLSVSVSSFKAYRWWE
jgi:hypothetical protein